MSVGSLAVDDTTPERAAYSRQVIRESLGAIRHHLGMEVAFVGRFHRGRRWFEYVDTDTGFAPIEQGGSDPLEVTYCARVADGRLPELIPDTADVAAARELDVTARLPVGSHISVPMRAGGGKPVGTLCCFSRHADPGLRTRDLSVMRVFADLIGGHLAFLLRHDQQARRTRARIDRVLAAGGPSIALQPVLNIDTGAVYGFEALARFPTVAGWTPERWFTEADRVGRGPALEGSAVRAALTLLPRLPPQAVLTMNLSPRALVEAPDLAGLLLGSDASRLVVELTEHTSIEDYARLEEHLAPLRRAGVGIAIDDAGSGYAGLERILRLRPDVLKLDRVLVQGISTHPGKRAMCHAMARFTEETGGVLVAEGVETEADLLALRELGVVYAQGFHLGRPQIPAAADPPESRAGHRTSG